MEGRPMSDASESGPDRKGDVESSISDSIRRDLKAKEPSEEEKARLRRAHNGHLVRETTFQLSVDAVGPWMEAEATAEIPDIYCFTCEEWIGVSGVDLRGTPRSGSEAFYLGWVPRSVRNARQGTRSTLCDLADALAERLDHLTDRDDALDFIEAEVECIRDAQPGIDQEGSR